MIISLCGGLYVVILLKNEEEESLIVTNITIYILSVYSPFSDRIGLPLHNVHIPSPFTIHISSPFTLYLKEYVDVLLNCHSYFYKPTINFGSNGPFLLIVVIHKFNISSGIAERSPRSSKIKQFKEQLKGLHKTNKDTMKVLFGHLCK